MPYAYVTGKPPDPGGGVSAQKLWKEMDDQYESAFWGDVFREPRSGMQLNDLQDGDIIMMDFEDYPIPGQAPHYAVVDQGKIYMIWNTPTPPGRFEAIDIQDWPKLFQGRTETDSHGATHKLRPYRYFDVYRKSKKP